MEHPDRAHSFDVPAGRAVVCFPEATDARWTAALVLEVDPERLTGAGGGRGRSAGSVPDGFTLGRFVNDRPYAASSMLSSAMVKVFRTAMSGVSRDRPELAVAAIPLQVRVPLPVVQPWRRGCSRRWVGR